MQRGFSTILAILVAVLAATIGVDSSGQTSSLAQRENGELRRQVNGFIKQLGSDSRNVRVTAERNLLRLGPSILPLLPPPELTPDVSIRETIRRIRIKLERDSAEASVLPSRVTLTGTQTLRDKLQEITKQTGNLLDGSQLSGELLDSKIAVDWQKQPFWSVIAQLEQRQGIAFQLTDSGESMRVKKRDSKTLVTAIAIDPSTAFRVVISRAEWRTLFGDDKHRLLRVHWDITAEPRLRPLFLKYHGQSLTASLKDGTALQPYSPEAKYEVSATDQSRPIELHSDFLVPKTVTISAIQLRGKLQMLTAAGQEQVTFRNLQNAAGSAIRRGGVTVTLQSAVLKPDREQKETIRGSVAIAVTYDVGGPAFESHRTWIFYNRAEMHLPGGKLIPREPGFKTELQRDGAVVVGYDFKLPAADAAKAEFVYFAPTLLIDVPIEFSFSKIPVPQTERKSP